MFYVIVFLVMLGKNPNAERKPHPFTRAGFSLYYCCTK